MAQPLINDRNKPEPMKILLVSATSPEIRPLLSQLMFNGSDNDQITHYRFRNAAVDVLVTGPGMVATAFHLGKQLHASSYDLAINTGICGSFNESIPIGTVVQVTRDFFPEMGAEDGESFLSLEQLGLTEAGSFPFTDGKIVSSGKPSSRILASLKKVLGITVNTVHGNDANIEKIRKSAEPNIESMEGAAFLFACKMAEVPCIQIRSVSNYVEVRDKSRWNIDLAVKNLNKTLGEILKEIAGKK